MNRVAIVDDSEINLTLLKSLMPPNPSNRVVHLYFMFFTIVDYAGLAVHDNFKKTPGIIKSRDYVGYSAGWIGKLLLDMGCNSIVGKTYI